MIPWSNRVRDGVLRVRRPHVAAQRNAADGTAIHGAVRHSTWAVVDRTASHVVASSSTPPAGRRELPVAVPGADHATRSTATRCGDDDGRERRPRAVPRGLRPPPVLPARAARRVGTVGAPDARGPCWRSRRRGGVPRSVNALRVDGAAPATVPRARTSACRARWASTFVDDVLTALEPGAPVRITYPDHGVDRRPRTPTTLHPPGPVRAPQALRYFAVEPVTNVNDGFALHDAGVPGTGVFVLEPGEERTGTFTVTACAPGEFAARASPSGARCDGLARMLGPRVA